MIRPVLRSVCAIALFAAASPAAVRAQDTFVIPPSFEDVCATGTASAQPFPFATAPQFNYPYRYHQVYDSSAFPAIAPGDVFLISEIAFRIDELSGGLEEIVYTDITVNLSTTDRGVGELVNGSPGDPDGLDANLGPDLVTVFSGGFTWDACETPDTCVPHVCGPDTSVPPFDQVITFTEPFAFDPAQGNLLLEVFNLDTAPQNQLFDAVEVPFPLTSRMREVIDPITTLHVWPTNLSDNVGLVTQFTYTAPEPGATAVAVVGLLALAALRRQRP